LTLTDIVFCFLQKEKDLELTARIGQELLTHNNQLETQVAALEVQLKEVHDRLEQTQHELHSKAELLAILAAEDDTSDPSKSIRHIGAKIS
jgi:trafficking kinesin-binding protein 1